MSELVSELDEQGGTQDGWKSWRRERRWSDEEDEGEARPSAVPSPPPRGRGGLSTLSMD